MHFCLHVIESTCLFSDFCQENSLSFNIDGDTNKH